MVIMLTFAVLSLLGDNTFNYVYGNRVKGSWYVVVSKNKGLHDNLIMGTVGHNQPCKLYLILR